MGVIAAFLETEGDAFTRKLIADTIEARSGSVRRLEFNTCDVTIDFEKGVVVVDDVLEADRSETAAIDLFLELISEA